MISKDWGDTDVMRGDIELIGGPRSPPTRENPGMYQFSASCQQQPKENPLSLIKLL